MNASSSTSQQLWLDGVQFGGIAGTPDVAWTTDMSLGSGKWSSYPATTGTIGDFAGQISDFAFFTRPLTQPQLQAMHATGVTAGNSLATIIRPSGGVDAAVTYTPGSDRVASVTDANNGTWTIGAPTVAGNGKAHNSAVLAAGPAET